MEQKQKNEKPAWVEQIEQLLPSARQNVGTIAAATIQNLACLYEISVNLFDAVIMAVEDEIGAKIERDLDEAARDIVDDSLKGD